MQPEKWPGRRSYRLSVVLFLWMQEGPFPGIFPAGAYNQTYLTVTDHRFERGTQYVLPLAGNWERFPLLRLLPRRRYSCQISEKFPIKNLMPLLPGPKMFW